MKKIQNSGLRTSLFITAASVLGILSVPGLSPQSVSAAPAFNPGNIIDDATMKNKSTMNVTQIQQFLNSKGASCTGSLCLKNYSEGGRSAARIIHDAAQAYDVNPQVFIVTLQKEVGLVTSTAPQAWMYRTAMGFGCPDSTPGVCNTSYYGFTNQLKSAGNFFRAHLQNNPHWYKPHVPGWNNILYNPNAACGTQRVLIENRATSALYSYTPYVPNKAALDAGYGTGNGCSAYGNRNFHLFFNSWFGSPFAKSIQVTRSMYFSPGSTQITQGDTTAVSFIIKNTSNATQSLDSIGVAVRDENDNSHDYPFKSVTLKPGESYEYYERRTFDEPGKYRMWIANRMDDGSWSDTFPTSSSNTLTRARTINVIGLPNITVSRSMFYSPRVNPSHASTEDITATSFVIRNNESTPVTLPEMRVTATHSDGSVQHYPSVVNEALKPGEEYTYYERLVFTKKGDYKLRAEFKLPSGRWSTSWPRPLTRSVATENDATIVDPPNVTYSRSLYVSPNPILVGQQIGSSFIIKNNEASDVTVRELRVRAKDSSGKNLDFPAVSNITLKPGEEYTYYQYRTFDKIDKYTFYPVAQVATNHHTLSWPSANNVVINRTYSSRLPDISLSRSMYFSPGNLRPVSGQSTAVSFVVRNNEKRTVTVPAMVVAVRDSTNAIHDYEYARGVTLKPGETYQYYARKTFEKKGSYRLTILFNRPDGGWSTAWPQSSSKTLVRTQIVNVR